MLGKVVGTGARVAAERVLEAHQDRAADRATENDAERAIVEQVQAGDTEAATRLAQALAAKNAARAEIERARTRRTTRRAIGAIAAAGLLGAGAVLGVRACGSLFPRVQTITRTTVGAELDKVRMRDDTIIITGEGKGTANTHSYARLCLGLCVTIPGSSENAGASVDSNLDVISGANAVTLQPGKSNGKWYAIATVNPRDLSVQLSNEQATLNGQDDFPIQVINAIGLSTDPNGRHADNLTVAEDNFEASCAPALTPVIPAAIANAIHNEIVQTDELLKGTDPTGYGILREIASQPVHIEFAVPSTSNGSTTMTPVSPSDIRLPVPPPIKSGTTTVSLLSEQVVFSIDTGGTCYETPGAAASIDKFVNDGGYVLQGPAR
jgi:hypothetical protein